MTQVHLKFIFHRDARFAWKTTAMKKKLKKKTVLSKRIFLSLEVRKKHNKYEKNKNTIIFYTKFGFSLCWRNKKNSFFIRYDCSFWLFLSFSWFFGQFLDLSLRFLVFLKHSRAFWDCLRIFLADFLNQFFTLSNTKYCIVHNLEIFH